MRRLRNWSGPSDPPQKGALIADKPLDPSESDAWRRDADRDVPAPGRDGDLATVHARGDVVSTIEGLAWPGVPGPYGASVLSLAFQLERSQWWPAAALRRHQFRQLETLLRHAGSTVPFFRERFAQVGFDPDEPLTEERWRHVPVLGRHDLQDHSDALRSEALPTSHGDTFELESSGSTGTAVRVVKTALTQLVWDAVTLRAWLWAGQDLSGTLATIRFMPGDHEAAYPKGARRGDWGSFARGVSTGPALTLNVKTPVDRQADWLARAAPDYLLTMPSNLADLARHCRDRGIALPSLKHVATMSEVLTPSVRDLCREVWGVEIRDMYSTQEVGHIALQCPAHAHYHVQAENALVEVVDDAGRPCRPGETGRVVVTALNNFAMALIRYDVGDFARLGPPCPCGRGLPVLDRILGRVRNMLTLPSGERIWPLLGFASFYKVAPVRQSQIVQRTRHALEVRIVADRGLTGPEDAAIRQIVLDRLGCPMDIRVVQVERLEPSAGGKFEEFRSEIAE